MKNAMKKLMSLLLVAVLLVSAVPFAASAAEGSVTVKVFQKVDGVDKNWTYSYSANTENGRDTVSNTFEKAYVSAEEFEGAWFINPNETEPNEKTADDTFPLNGGLLKIRKKAITTTPEDPSDETQAPADPDPVAPIKIVVKVNNSDNVVWEGTKVPSNGDYALVKNLLSFCWNSSWEGVYEFSHAYRYALDGTKGYTEGQDAKIKAGEEVHIMLKEKATTDSTGSGSTGSGSTGNGSGISNKDNTNKVYLHVYLNGNASTIVLTKDLGSTNLLDDDKTDTNEILKFLKANYYTAKDSSEAVEIDGLYVNYGNSGTFPQNYYTDNKVSAIDGIKDKLDNGYIHINVMLKNAKAKSTNTPDASNPKTGDNIFMVVSIMGVSAAALATAYYFYNKKRQAI